MADHRFDYSDVAQPEPCGWPDAQLVARRPTRENPKGEIAVYWPPLGETLGTAEWRSVVAMILRACDRADKENA